MKGKLPYPGLRPFHRDEADIFFGREEQTDDLLRKLDETRFLAVIGPSGCGKSSLVQAGMIAALEAGFMSSAGAEWCTAIMRPGSHPLQRLSETLLENQVFQSTVENNKENKSFLEAIIRRGPLGLVEVIDEFPLPEKTNLLLLVDQFEEIFRFRKEVDVNEADAFVSLLLETAEQRDIPIYIVITMRSEYLGDCAVFSGLPEVLNRGQYLTPRLTRDQRKAAIIGPAKVFGGEVEKDLLNELLNVTGTEPGQLPVLQHLLMRMWDSTKSQEVESINHFKNISLLEEFDGDAIGHKLRLSDYEKVGGLKNALSLHADEAFESLNEKQQWIAESMFRSLCDRGSKQRDTRRPTSISEIAERAGLKKNIKEVIAVVEVFRNAKYEFVVPALPEELYENTVIDISHESLIQLWQRLNLWVEDECRSVETYCFLAQSARLWKSDQGALWDTPNLENALSWKTAFKPKEVWAKRYNDDYNLAMQFLEESKKAHDIKIKQEQKKQHLKMQLAWISSFVFLIILLASTAYYYNRYIDYRKDDITYFNAIVKKYSSPEGYGQLNETQIKNRPVSFKITRLGKKGPVKSMEAINQNGKCTSAHNIGTYFEYKGSTGKAENICRWEYIRDADNNIMYEKMYDNSTNLVAGLLYTWIDSKKTLNVREAMYLDVEQLSELTQDSRVSTKRIDEATAKEVPSNLKAATTNVATTSEKKFDSKQNIAKKARDESLSPGQKYKAVRFSTDAKVVRITYDDQGREIQINYLDLQRNPIPGKDKAYGQKIKYDENGLEVTVSSLDQNGNLMNDEIGNAVFEVMARDSMGNILEAITLDVAGKKVITTSNWAGIKYIYDENGNIITESYFDTHGKNILHVNGYWKAEYIYVNGLITESKYYGIDEKPILVNDSVASWKSSYDPQGNILKTSYYDLDGNLSIQPDGFASWEYEYDAQGNITKTTYLDDKGKLVKISSGYAIKESKFEDKKEIEQWYFDEQEKPFMLYGDYHGVVKEFDANGNEIRRIYYGSNLKPVYVDYDGFAERKQRFDKNGNLIEIAYFDEKGQLTRNLDGYSILRKTYNDKNEVVSESYYDTNEQLTLIDNGFARKVNKYNDQGNFIGSKYYGADNKPVNIKEGYSSYESVTDDFGNNTTKYFDENDNPAVLESGYSGFYEQFNRQEKRLRTVYLGSDWKPVNIKSGYAEVVYIYDARGYLEKISYLDQAGFPETVFDGYAGLKYINDESGNVIKTTFLAINGFPVTISDGYASYESLVSYVDGNKVKAVKYFDEYDRPVNNFEGYAGWTEYYNESGDAIQTIFLDLNGKPKMLDLGYASFKSDYNSSGKLIEQRFYDANNNPVMIKDNYFRFETKYNDIGLVAEQATYDLDGNLIVNKFGYARILKKYDESDNLVEEKYLGVDNQPVFISGFTKFTRIYDRQGNMLEEAYYGPDDNLIVSEYGFARMIKKFDKNNNLIGEAYFGSDNKPIAVDGYAQYKVVYDDNGNSIEHAYYGIDGNLIVTTYGYAKITKKFDKRNNLIEESYFDSNNQPVLVDGFSSYKVLYDEQNNIVEEAYYGTDGKLIAPYLSNYARISRKYDAKGNLLEETYYDANNRLINTYKSF